MSKEENVRKIKSYIDDVLKTKSSLKEKLPLKVSKKKQLFCDMLKDLQFANDRSIGLKHDYNMDMVEYDDPFYNIIDSLLKLHFNQEQQNIINWWLYEKFLPTGDSLNLLDKNTEKEIPTDTPEEIFEILKNLEKKHEN